MVQTLGANLARRCARCNAACVGGGLCPRCLLLDGLDELSQVAHSAALPSLLNAAPVPQSWEQEIPSLDGYQVLSELGRGGMGVVYLAEQTRPVRRRVALKLIKLGMDTRQVIARFEAERQALAVMEHPNVAKVLDGGASSGGRPYFVMELVRGPRITEYSDQFQLSMRERLELFLQVCRAIEHAHQKGIIHRDIKPSNILVTQQDGLAVPKVIDFGIAKATDGQFLSETFTTVDQFLGTPAYTSPEQASGERDIDTRSDIYSLGVLLYELLAGKPPFDSRELAESGWETMRRTIRETEPQRPSTRLTILKRDELSRIASRRRMEPLKLIHVLRGDLDWIVMKCLEKERARRYSTCAGLAHDIERYLHNEPVIARPPSNVYRFQKWIRRNMLVFVSITAIITALATGVGIASWSLVKEKEAKEKASEAQRRAEAQNEISLLREQQARASEAEARAALEFFNDSHVTRKFLFSTNRFELLRGATLKAQTQPRTNDLEAVSHKRNNLHPALPTLPADSPTATNGILNSIVPATSSLTYSQWAAVWWKWMMELPVINSAGAIHPNIDSPSFDATEGQSGEVWFFAAPFGNVIRDCIVPADKWLFVALLNTESSSLETQPFFGKTAQEQFKIAHDFTDHVAGLFCEIDGVPIPNITSYRFANPQIQFNAPSPWIYGETGGPATSTGDGYFLLVSPLGPGRHTLHFGGAFYFNKPGDVFDETYELEMTYNITVP